MRRHVGAFLPAFLCVALFGATVFWLVLPETEKAILAKKQEMIRELSQTVLSLLASYEQQERTGLLDRGQAQERALTRIGAMRYGSDGKNYFWVMDTATKTMLMHPYAPEMVGQDLSDYTDAQGAKIFQPMFQVLEQQGAGYVSYYFQYMDDPGRVALKTSYVARFAPWDWAVGTGVYNEDVHAEMAKLTKALTWAGVAVWLMVTLLGVYITMRNIRMDRQNQAAQQSLRESAQKFRSVSANALDGIIMVDSGHQITFWNKAAENIFGFQASEVLGQNALALLTPQRHHEEYLATFRGLLAADQGLVLGNTLELVAINKQGQEFPVEVSVTALHMGGQWHVVCVVRNIVKRKQAEKALAESEKLYRTLFEKAGEAIFLIHDNLIVDCNSEAERIFGVRREMLLGRSPADLSPERQADGSDTQTLALAMLDQVQAGTPLILEWLHKRQDGTVFDAEVSLINIELTDKTFQLAVVRDISARKRAEAALRESEANLRMAQSVGGVGSYEVDLATGAAWGSEEAARIYGLEDYPTRCLPFEFVQSLTLAADRPRLDQALNLLLNHDVPYEQEYSIQRASDKQLHQVVSKAEVVRDAQGRPFKVLGTVQDITERKRAEEEIKKREATLRGILKASPSGIAMVSFPQRCLVWANERLCEMTGYRLEDLLGMPTSLLYLDDDEYERVGRQATEEIKTNGFSTLQSRWRGQDGRGLDVLLNVSAIHPDDLSAGLVFTALDVTQRVRAEEEIRQSEATLQSILKASPSGIAMITYTDRRLIWANQRMAEITGYPLDELLGMPTRKLYFDDNEYEKASQRTRQGIRAQGFSTFQALARAKDGRALDILMNVAPMIPEDPKAGLVFTALDITQRVRAEEEIRQSEATLRSILKASPSGIAQVSYPARRIIWANERMSEMTGYPVQDLLGMSTRDLYLDPHDFDLTAAEVPEMLMSRGVASFESQWSRRDGAVMDVLINVSPLNPHDLAAGQVSSVLDITDSKRAQELVRRNEEKYRLILEATPDPVVLYDMKGLVVYLNPAFTRVFGWTLEELAGRKVDYVPQDELAKTDEMIALMQQGTFLSDFETRRYDRWGNILSVAVSWSAWRDENGTPAGSVVVLRDVTEHKKMLAQLEQARKMEAVGTLAGGIAHDFNNVLQAISGNVQLLMMSPELDARPKKTLADIDNLTQRAAEMIQQLLTISRKREVKLQAVSLDQEVRQMCRLLERIIPKMITMDLQLDPNLWPINGDQTQLEQIILNLAGNAADAMPQGGTLTFQTENQDIDEVFCRTHPELRPGPHVLLRVADTGQGMDKETLKHLFEPFFTTKQSGQGTGLGLSTVYGIVTSHLGLITCYSTPGQGTAFNLYFPALIGEEGSRYRAYPRLEEGPRGGSETLLLVDDEADILQVGREILGMFGYSVLTCASGEEALSLYSDKSDEIDLVILDLNMPGMGGHRCLEGLLHVDPQARVIISSGYYTHLTARDLGKAGARGFIAKPYRLSDMVKRVREVLDNVQA